MVCPNGCICDKMMFIECNFENRQQDELSFNFPLKKLAIYNNENFVSLNFRENTHILEVFIQNSPMKKILPLNTPNLFFFILKYNKIKELNSLDLNRMRNLQYLDLTGNKIYVIPDDFFSKSINLLYVDLSKNLIRDITNKIFENLRNLNTLIITKTSIEKFHKDSLKYLLNLENLYLNHTILPRFLPLHLLKSLKNLKKLYSKSYYLCCMTKKYGLKMKECRPNSSLIKACLDLIGNVYLRIFIWIIVILGLIGNIIALFIQQKKLKPSSIFYMSLHVSDIFLIIYLTIIGVVDAYYKGNYMENDANWRFSALCSFAGALANISFMNSNFCLILITADRYLAICHNLFHKRYLYKIKQFLLASTICLCFSCLVGILPIFIFEVKINMHKKNIQYIQYIKK